MTSLSTLIVLGAGASIGARRYPIASSLYESFPAMPSSRDFFYDLFQGKLAPGRGRRFLNILGLTYEGTHDLVSRAWGIEKPELGFDPEEWRNVNVEEVLSFIDIGARLHPSGSAGHRAFSIARRQLVTFIVDMLAFRSDGQHCELLLDLFSDLGPTDSVYSFNYDALADQTLLRLKAPQYTNYVALMAGLLPPVRAYQSRGLLIKLHGSVNWRECTNRKCSRYRLPYLPLGRRHELPPLTRSYPPCPECGSTPPEVSLIPPTAEKQLHRRGFFQRLWLIARAQLPRFRRVIFIGYSFPPNDSYSDWLFRHFRFLDTPPPEIVVINPEATKRRHLVRARYDRLFKGFPIEYFTTLEPYLSSESRRKAAAPTAV